MIELRTIASGTYKGLIFCSGYESAKTAQNVLRKYYRNIKGKLKIEIKRGCTEYGIEHPNYKVLDETSNNFMRYNKNGNKRKYY